jgi:hypothetical protein
LPHGHVNVTIYPMSNISVFEQEELVSLEELLQLPPLRRFPPDVFGRLRRRGLFPYVAIGHKTYLYNPARVLEALKKLERPAKEGQ